MGHPQRMIDGSGRVVWAATYDSFGNARVDTAEVVNNLRLPGQYFDAETGLHYNWFRYYSPQTGRYLQTDPLMDGLNLYSYVRSRPLTYIDPYGLCGMSPLQQTQAVLDLVGIFDPTGLADLANAVLYLFQGEWGYAAVSGIAMLPYLGDLPKFGKYGDEVAEVVSKNADGFVDLASPQRRRHILDGDATGGGHRFGTGNPGKSEFPHGWSDDKIMHEISDIATDPNAARKSGRGGRTIAEGTRDGLT